MRAFGRSCSFVSGSDLAASTVPGGTNVASGAVFPSLSEPPQQTQTLGEHFSCDLFCSLAAITTFYAAEVSQCLPCACRTLPVLSYTALHCRCVQRLP